MYILVGQVRQEKKTSLLGNDLAENVMEYFLSLLLPTKGNRFSNTFISLMNKF